jgi:DNA-binding transcriptional regulator YiaG
MMPNIVSVLKAEITRLARKEIRDQTDALKKVISSQRTDIAALKRRLQELEKSVRQLNKDSTRSARSAQAAAAKSAEEAQTSHRFSAKGLASHRQRLELSAADFGLLVGTTGQSVYNWESGKTQPKPDALAAIAAIRKAGKREVQARLAQLRGE